MRTARETLVSRAGQAMPVVVILILGVMIIPLPAIMLDLLITTNLMVSVVLLMVALTLLKPVEFSVFPSLLLVSTLFRLGLNVASTRLILLGGLNGEASAGEVIKAFGNFVVGGDPVVGAAVFLALIIIQYVVINHGAVRVSEVIARFTLDALPGKQMAVDADLNSGAITDEEARDRRKEIAREAEFYGSMDGAVRFSQRDSVAAIILMTINVLAGLALGILKHGMSPLEAVSLFTILTIGDGIVAAIPALLISVAGGIITTRAAARDRLGSEIATQLLAAQTPLYATAGVLLGLSLVPGLPMFPFLALATLCAFVASRAGTVVEEAGDEIEIEPPPSDESEIADLIQVDAVSIELGFSLLSLADEAMQGDLLGRVKTVRRQVAQELGLLVPAIRVRDKVDLAGQEYRIRINDAEVARGSLMPHSLLAILPAPDARAPDGIQTTDPTFGLPARWIRRKERDKAIACSCTVVEPSVVLATHLGHVLRGEGWRLLGRTETREILDAVQAMTGEEVVPKLLSLGTVQQVMRNLLTEGVSLRDGLTIVDTLALASEQTKDADELTAMVRVALGPAICSKSFDPEGRLKVFALGAELEEGLRQASGEGGPGPDLMGKVAEALQRAFVAAPGEPTQVLLCSPLVRPMLRRVVERVFPAATVLSHAEVPDTVPLVRLGDVA